MFPVFERYFKENDNFPFFFVFVYQFEKHFLGIIMWLVPVQKYFWFISRLPKKSQFAGKKDYVNIRSAYNMYAFLCLSKECSSGQENLVRIEFSVDSGCALHFLSLFFHHSYTFWKFYHFSCIFSTLYYFFCSFREISFFF